MMKFKLFLQTLTVVNEVVGLMRARKYDAAYNKLAALADILNEEYEDWLDEIEEEVDEGLFPDEVDESNYYPYGGCDLFEDDEPIE